MKLVWLIAKNIRRNFVRSILTALGTMVLVFVVTLVWSVLWFLDKETASRSTNLKAVITERWQLPSRMPLSYAAGLSEGAPRDEGDYRVAPKDSMTWQFFVGFVGEKPSEMTFESIMFAIAMEPDRILTMLNELDELPKSNPAAAAALQPAIDRLAQNRQGVIVGPTRLKMLNRRVGDRVTVSGIADYKDLKLELEIVGVFPEGRYDSSAVMNRDYLNAALDAYQAKTGKPHPLADKTLNLVWVRVPDMDAFNRVATQVTTNPSYQKPAVKCETASSGVAAFLEAYRTLLWGMRVLLAPAVWITLSLVIANAISISVRERQMEFAVLKVLGFRPGHILALVLGEALLVGVLSGLASAGLTWWTINGVFGGLKFPIAFFPAFLVPARALWWGPAIGGLASFVGSAIPAWSARTVKVSDVFARVA